MTITNARVSKTRGTHAERFSEYLNAVTNPSDIAVLVRSFELSLRAANKSPNARRWSRGTGRGTRSRVCHALEAKTIPVGIPAVPTLIRGGGRGRTELTDLWGGTPEPRCASGSLDGEGR